jgi:hypothetical protein
MIRIPHDFNEDRSRQYLFNIVQLLSDLDLDEDISRISKILRQKSLKQASERFIIIHDVSKSDPKPVLSDIAEQRKKVFARLKSDPIFDKQALFLISEILNCSKKVDSQMCCGFLGKKDFLKSLPKEISDVLNEIRLQVSSSLPNIKDSALDLPQVRLKKHLLNIRFEYLEKTNPKLAIRSLREACDESFDDNKDGLKISNNLAQYNLAIIFNDKEKVITMANNGFYFAQVSYAKLLRTEERFEVLNRYWLDFGNEYAALMLAEIIKSDGASFNKALSYMVIAAQAGIKEAFDMLANLRFQLNGVEQNFKLDGDSIIEIANVMLSDEDLRIKFLNGNLIEKLLVRKTGPDKKEVVVSLNDLRKIFFFFKEKGFDEDFNCFKCVISCIKNMEVRFLSPLSALPLSTPRAEPKKAVLAFDELKFEEALERRRGLKAGDDVVVASPLFAAIAARRAARAARAEVDFVDLDDVAEPKPPSLRLKISSSLSARGGAGAGAGSGAGASSPVSSPSVPEITYGGLEII